MKVLLVYPNAKTEIVGWGDTGAIAEPIALEYVGAAARQAGHEVRLLDLRLHNDKLDQSLSEFGPDVVAVTGYSMHVLRALEVCRIAKAQAPDCVTVAGGLHATLEPVDFDEPEMDFIVEGEGTQAFTALLAQLEQRGRADEMPGVWSRGSHGATGPMVRGGDPPPLDIDAISPPARDLVAADRHRYFIDWMKPVALLRTTVGCPFRCTFCSLWRLMDGRYHTRQIDDVVEELAKVPEPFVFLVDDEPFVNPGRMKALAKAIAKAGIDKQYFCYGGIEPILKNRDVVAEWHNVGLRRLAIGVESIFDHELADYNKRQRREDIIAGIQAAKEIGIRLFANFIISPRYTDTEFDETIRFIREHGVDYPSFTILTPLPGAVENFDDVVVRQPNGRPNWDYFDLQHPVTETAMPRDAFMARFQDLYQVFIENYHRAESPLTVSSFGDRAQAQQDHYAAIAAQVLGINRPPSKG